MMASLEQLATENQIAPLSPPDLDPHQIEIPESGPFIYEFDVEVCLEFDLPSYKGLTLKRPIKTFSQTDIDKERKRILEPAGQLVAQARCRRQSRTRRLCSCRRPHDRGG